MSLPKMLAKIGGPILAIGILAALPVIGSTAASADGSDPAPAAAATTTPPPDTTDGNPWHG
jgi:hypothetical protein